MRVLVRACERVNPDLLPLEVLEASTTNNVYGDDDPSILDVFIKGKKREPKPGVTLTVLNIQEDWAITTATVICHTKESAEMIVRSLYKNGTLDLTQYACVINYSEPSDIDEALEVWSERYAGLPKAASTNSVKDAVKHVYEELQR